MKPLTSILAPFLAALPCPVALPCAAQSGFDYVGPDDALTTGNHFFLSQDQLNGSFAVSAQPWQPAENLETRELWVVWGQATMDLTQVSEWRVGIWSGLDELVADPLHGNLLDQSLAAPDLGDPSTPFGQTFNGRDTFLIGFSIDPIPLGTTESYYFGVYALADPATQGAGGPMESAVLAASGVQAGNLVPGGWIETGDSPESFHAGTLAYRLVVGPASFTFCAGDGSGTTCPCGNDGALGHGCANGTFPAGAELGVSGTASVGNDTLSLVATTSTPSQPGLFFQGDNAVAGGDGLPFGDGLRCAGGNVVRLQTLAADPAGAAASSVPVAATGGVSPGDLKRYQWWYRDPAASPCGFQFNLSNGVEITWLP